MDRVAKSDKQDAFGLAEQLRIGAIERRVYKGRGQFGRLGNLATAQVGPEVALDPNGNAGTGGIGLGGQHAVIAVAMDARRVDEQRESLEELKGVDRESQLGLTRVT